MAGGVVGALFLVFSETFWNNAIEAEVYGLAAFMMALLTWLGLRWYDARTEPRSDWLLLLMIYLLGLGVGFHLGTLLVYPGIFVLVWLSRDRKLPVLDLLLMQRRPGPVPALDHLHHQRGRAARPARRLRWPASAARAAGRPPLRAAGAARCSSLGLSVHAIMMIRAGATPEPVINQTDARQLQDPAVGAAPRAVPAAEPVRSARRRCALAVPATTTSSCSSSSTFLGTGRGAADAGSTCCSGPIFLGLLGLMHGLRRARPLIWLLLAVLPDQRRGPDAVPELHEPRGARARLLLLRGLHVLRGVHRTGRRGAAALPGRRRGQVGGAVESDRRRLARAGHAGEAEAGRCWRPPGVLLAAAAAAAARARAARSASSTTTRNNRIAYEYAWNILAGLRPERHPVHQRRQRHVPDLVPAGGREIPPRRHRGQPVAGEPALVHQAAASTPGDPAAAAAHRRRDRRPARTASTRTRRRASSRLHHDQGLRRARHRRPPTGATEAAARVLRGDHPAGEHGALLPEPADGGHDLPPDRTSAGPDNLPTTDSAGRAAEHAGRLPAGLAADGDDAARQRAFARDGRAGRPTARAAAWRSSPARACRGSDLDSLVAPGRREAHRPVPRPQRHEPAGQLPGGARPRRLRVLPAGGAQAASPDRHRPATSDLLDQRPDRLPSEPGASTPFNDQAAGVLPAAAGAGVPRRRGHGVPRVLRCRATSRSRSEERTVLNSDARLRARRACRTWPSPGSSERIAAQPERQVLLPGAVQRAPGARRRGPGRARSSTPGETQSGEQDPDMARGPARRSRAGRRPRAGSVRTAGGGRA